ncbi:MAG: hypothetical protein WA750_14300 [Pseudolabrys sp.]
MESFYPHVTQGPHHHQANREHDEVHDRRSGEIPGHAVHDNSQHQPHQKSDADAHCARLRLREPRIGDGEDHVDCIDDEAAQRALRNKMRIVI